MKKIKQTFILFAGIFTGFLYCYWGIALPNYRGNGDYLAIQTLEKIHILTGKELDDTVNGRILTSIENNFAALAYLYPDHPGIPVLGAKIRILYDANGKQPPKEMSVLINQYILNVNEQSQKMPELWRVSIENAKPIWAPW